MYLFLFKICIFTVFWQIKIFYKLNAAIDIPSIKKPAVLTLHECAYCCIKFHHQPVIVIMGSVHRLPTRRPWRGVIFTALHITASETCTPVEQTLQKVNTGHSLRKRNTAVSTVEL